MVERGSSPGDYLVTSVDQLVTLLLAKYACEVAMALPRTKRILRAARSDTDNVSSSGVNRKSSAHVQNGAIDPTETSQLFMLG